MAIAGAIGHTSTTGFSRDSMDFLCFLHHYFLELFDLLRSLSKEINSLTKVNILKY